MAKFRRGMSPPAGLWGQFPHYHIKCSNVGTDPVPHKKDWFYPDSPFYHNDAETQVDETWTFNLVHLFKNNIYSIQKPDIVKAQLGAVLNDKPSGIVCPTD
jgi:hypothetical protein